MDLSFEEVQRLNDVAQISKLFCVMDEQDFLSGYLSPEEINECVSAGSKNGERLTKLVMKIIRSESRGFYDAFVAHFMNKSQQYKKMYFSLKYGNVAATGDSSTQTDEDEELSCDSLVDDLFQSLSGSLNLKKEAIESNNDTLAGLSLKRQTNSVDVENVKLRKKRKVDSNSHSVSLDMSSQEEVFNILHEVNTKIDTALKRLQLSRPYFESSAESVSAKRKISSSTNIFEALETRKHPESLLDTSISNKPRKTLPLESLYNYNDLDDSSPDSGILFSRVPRKGYVALSPSFSVYLNAALLSAAQHFKIKKYVANVMRISFTRRYMVEHSLTGRKCPIKSFETLPVKPAMDEDFVDALVDFFNSLGVDKDSVRRGIVATLSSEVRMHRP